MKKRAVFEEVAAAGRAPAPAPGAADRARARGRLWTARWLLALAALVTLMVLVGGLTRLTDSGLAMVGWHPVLEAIPPLTPEAWAAEFERYRRTTQFREVNAWMGLEDFKTIYWWEWGHRQLGRVIGLVWAAGLAVLLVRRMVPPGFLWPVVAPGLLGGVQAVVGMWMVDSGVAEGSALVSVAPYRLAVHLGLAFLILGLLLWPAWRLLRPEWAQLQARRRRAGRPMAATATLVALCFVQIVLGALLAGNDAGRGYTDWPLMDGHVLPPSALDLEPLWRNLVWSPALTQFNHRVAGYALMLAAVLAWLAARRAGPWPLWALAAVWAQAAWGVLTVLHAAPLGLAIVHQAGAVATFALCLRARFDAAYPAERGVRG